MEKEGIKTNPNRVRFIISIDSYRRVEDKKGSEYTTYEIKDYNGDVTVYRRYNQFLYLYNRLSDLDKNWPEFPKKIYFGRFKGDVLAERLQVFTEILAVISGDQKLHSHPEVKRFLDPKVEYECD